MLECDDDYIVRILGIDPSLINLGVAFGLANIKDRTVTIVNADTYYIKLLMGFTKDDDQIGFSNRTLQVQKVNQLVTDLIKNLKPDVVVTEEPVYSSNAYSLKNQMESITAIRMAVLNTMPEDVVIYFPGAIKKTVDAAGKDKASSKEPIKEGLLELVAKGELFFKDPETTYPTLLDEHSNDAIAMVMTKAKELFV